MRRSSLPFNFSILRPISWCKVAWLKQEQGDKKHDHTFFLPVRQFLISGSLYAIRPTRPPFHKIRLSASLTMHFQEPS
ncbi:hypothetical protein GIB67_033640 [Kingdonia uniflora]|uniref:Uncharacterized protein n=1 Tax=Kingdonia uniflora TaxID=39325 RepID=A0A7J7LAE1_9MAGN|nr:hypothetical protein GIB67_033640 [Kingdonia uniflora]